MGTTPYFTLNIFTDYLQFVYLTTFGLQRCVYSQHLNEQKNRNKNRNKIRTVQGSAALKITGAIKVTSRENLYQEKGF